MREFSHKAPNIRRRNCPGCGRWMNGGEDLCLECDPVCDGCDDRVSEAGELNEDNLCAGCVTFDLAERNHHYE